MTGRQVGDWTSAAPGLFSALAAGGNLFGGTEVLGVNLSDSQISGEVFNSSGVFVEGFFTTASGRFRDVILAP